MKLNFCVACGSNRETELENHHLIPRSLGGADDDTNLITLCFECHGKLHGVVRRDIRALTRDALHKRKAQGQRVGSIPYGYHLGSDGQTLEADPAEQEVVSAVLKYRDAGLGTRLICQRLEKDGFSARSGGVFFPQTISRIIEADRKAA